MARYGMVLNLDRCIGCYNCQIACKDEHVANEFPPISKPQPTYAHFWIRIREWERVLSPSRIRVVYVPIPCQQCGDAPCIPAARDGAVYRRPDGIVVIDPVKARGQEQLVRSCPYGAIFWNDEQQLPQKCTFCAHLLDDGWSEPRCVQSCPAGCMSFGDLDDPQSPASRQLSELRCEALHPEFRARPNVHYCGLPKPHLSGRVVLGDRDEWAADARITATDQDGKKRETRTDFFGDFEFEGLEQKAYSVHVDAPGYGGEIHEVTLGQEAHYLGEVVLRR